MKQLKSIELNFKFDRRRLILIGLPVLGLLVGLGGYLALVSPQHSKDQAALAEIGQLRVALSAPRTPPATPVAVHATDIFKLAKAMPDSADVPGALRELSRLSAASGVTIQSVRPSPQVVLPAGYAALPIAVTVNGTYSGVSSFLGRLRRDVTVGATLSVSGRLFLANQLQLTAGTGSMVTAILNLDAFVYGVANPAAPVAGIATPTTSTTTPGHP